MELTVTTELRGKVLQVMAAGPVSLGASLRLYKQVCDEAQKNGVRKILVNCLAVRGEISTFERYELATELGKHFTTRQFNPYLANVGQQPTLNGFAATVAQNRGISFAVFPTIEAATIWLAIWPD